MKRRHGFTLVEMTVVILIIVILAGLAAAFIGGPRKDVYAVTNAANELQAWLLGAKMRAKRDGVPTGLRIVADAGGATASTFQLVQQIDISTVGYFPGTTTIDPAHGMLTASAYDPATRIMTLSFAEVDFSLGGLPANQWLVQPGDYFILRDGTPHVITGVLPTQLIFADIGNTGYNQSLAIAMPTHNYRIQASFRPIPGESPLTMPGVTYVMNAVGQQEALPGSVFLDLASMQQYGMVLPSRVAGTYDVIFLPSGQVLSGAGGRYMLWLRFGSHPITELESQAIVAVPINGGDAVVRDVAPPPNPFALAQQ